MKVLHVIDSLILAGVEVLLAEMIPRFRQRGLEVSVGVLKPLDSPLERDLRASGISFLPNPTTRIYSPFHVRTLTKHLHEYDVVQSYLFPAQLWVAMAAARSRKPVPLVTTEQSTHARRRKAWFHPVDRWMYNRYRAIACNSQATADALEKWLPELTPKLSVVPNGIALERFQAAAPARPPDSVPDDGLPLVLFTARLEPAKDHATLLRAFAKVPNARLLLAGDGTLRVQLEALAASLGIAGRVHFLGRRPDIPQLLKLADVYVHSSHIEGFGIAAVEAMAAGLPVIASEVPGLGEVVRGAGLLFPAGDADALAQQISLVLASPALRDQLSQASQQRAQDFSIERSVEAYLNIYRSVTAPAAGAAHIVQE